MRIILNDNSISNKIILPAHRASIIIFHLILQSHQLIIGLTLKLINRLGYNRVSVIIS